MLRGEVAHASASPEPVAGRDPRRRDRGPPARSRDRRGLHPERGPRWARSPRLGPHGTPRPAEPGPGPEIFHRTPRPPARPAIPDHVGPRDLEALLARAQPRRRPADLAPGEDLRDLSRREGGARLL